MIIREQIIKQLDKPFNDQEYMYAEFGQIHTTPYSALKQSIELDWDKIPKRSDSVELEDRIDDWFKGVINSLYYRPNKLVFVLEGEKGIGKTEFFRRLLPSYSGKYMSSYYNETWASLDCSERCYDYLILNFDFTKLSLNLPIEENFKICNFSMDEVSIMPNGVFGVGGRIESSDKRLASYCSTTNKWNHPPRKNFIIVPVKRINQELFNSINKELLWIEIFNKFKPEL